MACVPTCAPVQATSTGQSITMTSSQAAAHTLINADATGSGAYSGDTIVGSVEGTQTAALVMQLQQSAATAATKVMTVTAGGSTAITGELDVATALTVGGLTSVTGGATVTASSASLSGTVQVRWCTAKFASLSASVHEPAVYLPVLCLRRHFKFYCSCLG